MTLVDTVLISLRSARARTHPRGAKLLTEVCHGFYDLMQ